MSKLLFLNGFQRVISPKSLISWNLILEANGDHIFLIFEGSYDS